MKGIRVAIVHNQESKSVEVTKRLTTLLEQSENKIDQDNPELVISVGGDGSSAVFRRPYGASRLLHGLARL